MADPAVLSVVFTGTVGVMGALAAVSGHFVTLRTGQDARREERIADLRDVLDEAAKVAMEFDLAFDEDVLIGEVAKHVADLRSRAALQLGRIGVRVGPTSTLYVEYERLLKALAGIDHALSAMPGHTALFGDAVPEGLQEGERAKMWEAIGTGSERSRAALTAFLAAARGLVGVDVG